MVDLAGAHDLARSFGRRATGHDPGPLTAVASQSSHVFVGADIVVKLAEHHRLDREVRLVGDLPEALTPKLIASGLETVDTRPVQFACYLRAPGVSPGMGLPGVDRATARSLASQAVRRLALLHEWHPPQDAARVLREPLDHGGFTSRDALVSLVERLASTDRERVVRRTLVDGLVTVAQQAPVAARADVPVHADCYWDNWLACDGTVTALLDFEWARFGDPLDDYHFLISFSGEHVQTVLDVIAHEAAIPPQTLRRECEVREASFLVSDIVLALDGDEGDLTRRLLARRLDSLEQLVVGQRWRQR